MMTFLKCSFKLFIDFKNEARVFHSSDGLGLVFFAHKLRAVPYIPHQISLPFSRNIQEDSLQS